MTIVSSLPTRKKLFVLFVVSALVLSFALLFAWFLKKDTLPNMPEPILPNEAGSMLPSNPSAPSVRDKQESELDSLLSESPKESPDQQSAGLDRLRSGAPRGTVEQQSNELDDVSARVGTENSSNGNHPGLDATSL